MLATENKVDMASSWPIQGLGLYPCIINEPFGIAIMQGYYDAKSVSSATSLLLWAPGPWNCPNENFVADDYDFQPLGDLSYESKLAGFWTNNPDTMGNLIISGTFHNFIPGVYTVVGGDEWGAMVILHFTVL
jgi:hypothetical protein